LIKVVLITGAARRIGAACVRSFHADGYNVVLHFNSSAQAASELAAELNQIRPDSVRLVSADLLDLGLVHALAEKALACWGAVDILVNNASLFYASPVGEIGEKAWNDLIGSNLKAPLFLSQALVPILRKRCGCIVNVVDIHADKGLSEYAVYCIAKAGLVAMTKCLAKELAPDVRVNAVAPGAILWPEQAISDAQKSDILNKVPLQRCGTEEDVAKAVRFLAQDADYITGQVLNVDGGRLLFG
jgi:pteridine reductase